MARKGKWKLHSNPEDTSKKGKLSTDDTLYFVNLESDPNEMKNLASVHPENVNELKKQYENWEKNKVNLNKMKKKYAFR